MIMFAIGGLTTPPTALAGVLYTSTVVETFPVSTTFEGCGDVIQLSGEIKHVLHITSTTQGLIIEELLNPSGVTGIGLVSGATYRGVAPTKTSFTTIAADSLTLVNNFKLISTGRTANFLLTLITHLTEPASGDSKLWSHLTVKCSG